MKRIFLPLLLLIFGAAHAAQPIQTWTLANGTRVLLVENHTIPIIDISINFDGGSRRDPQGKSGVASMTNALLSSGLAASAGEPALSEAQISDNFADTAAQFSGSAGSDRASMSLRTLSSQRERTAAILLVARILAHPAFPEQQLTREKIRAVAAIKEADTKPASIANKAFMRAMYGSHPYSQTPTAASVEAITRADLVSFHRQHYVTNRAVIAIIGDTTRAQAEAIVQQLTTRLPRADAALPIMPPVALTQANEQRFAHPASQAHILIGMPALERGDPDYFALMVGNYILGGGGFVSRLMHEVREQRGLSYGVSSAFQPRKQAGPFQISLQTKKEQTDAALKVTRETLAAFLRDGPTETEMKAAKDNMIGGFALHIDTNKKLLDNLAVIGYYGLPLDYLDTWRANVAKVTIADVRAAFKRKVAQDRMVTVIVGVSE